MQDYQLAALGLLDRSYRTAHIALVATELKAVATAFIGNVDRVLSASAVPMRLIHILPYFHEICREAWKKIMQEHDFLKAQRVDLTVSLEFAAECKSLIEKYIEDRKANKEGRILIGGPAPFTPPWFEMWDTMDYNVNGIDAPTMFIVDAMVTCSGEFLSKGAESMLSNMVVGMWTAFETLAGDLWEAVVNAHPHGLAQLAGKSKRDGQDKRDQAKMVQFALLELYNFDLRNVMGTMQRKMEKVGFTTLDKIRGAYADAFGNESPAICKVLDDPALDNLSIVRNVIVHKAGVCDKEYKDKSEGKTLIPQLGVGDPLHLALQRR